MIFDENSNATNGVRSIINALNSNDSCIITSQDQNLKITVPDKNNKSRTHYYLKIEKVTEDKYILVMLYYLPKWVYENACRSGKNGLVAALAYLHNTKFDFNAHENVLTFKNATKNFINLFEQIQNYMDNVVHNYIIKFIDEIGTVYSFNLKDITIDKPLKKVSIGKY